MENIYSLSELVRYLVFQLDSFPLSMSYGRDQLWLGQRTGSVVLIDASDKDFDIVAVSLFSACFNLHSIFCFHAIIWKFLNEASGNHYTLILILR